MKIKIKKLQWLAAIIVVSLFVMGSCSKPEIYENRNIPACGVSDPLQNIEWLREHYESANKTRDILSVDISLYKIIGSNENVFQISTFMSEFVPNQGHVGQIEWKNCIGEIIFIISRPGSPPYPGMVESFMADKEFVAELYSFNRAKQ